MQLEEINEDGKQGWKILCENDKEKEFAERCTIIVLQKLIKDGDI